MSRVAGQAAEQRAAQHLESLGYKVLHRNYTCRLGELDLVCEDRETLVFVEVRQRRVDRYGAAVETITAQKIKKLARTARHFLMRYGFEDRACRFDVVTIQGGEEPELMKDAFQTAPWE